MVNIKRFLDKISSTEGKRATSVVLPIEDARGLRDEIAKLLSDLHELNNKNSSNDIIKVEITGGKFK
jgi:hypothetical protein